MYPPPPLVGDEVCGAAAYIVSQIRDLIVEVFQKLSTLEPQEVLNSLMGSSGWSVEHLWNLITTTQENLENQINLLATYDNEADELICELATHALDKTIAIAWVESHYNAYDTIRDFVIYAINAAADDGRWAQWIVVGSHTPADCVDCVTPDVDLIAASGFPSNTVRYVDTNSLGDRVDIEAVYTGHYAVAHAISQGSVPFFILGAELISGTMAGSIMAAGGEYQSLASIPNNIPMTSISFYQVPPGTVIRFTISDEAPRSIYLRKRTDGAWAGFTLTIEYVGSTPTGGAIYDLTNAAGQSHNAFGVDTVDQSLGALKSAYLYSVTSNDVVVNYHYHEQFTTSGDGAGISGTLSSKKWGFYANGQPFGKTIRVRFEPNPY